MKSKLIITVRKTIQEVKFEPLDIAIQQELFINHTDQADFENQAKTVYDSVLELVDDCMEQRIKENAELFSKNRNYYRATD